MNGQMIITLAAIVPLTVIAILISIKLTIKKILSNHKYFVPVCKRFYNYFYTIKKTAHLRTNNFGFAPVDEEIARYEPHLHYGLQLYKELVKNGNGYLIHKHHSVVEVGCGRGAGAEFLLHKFSPQHYTGVDFSYRAIDFCINHYQQYKNASFVCADAHKLPFADGSADVVLNVESSHLYKSSCHFFAEVHRILKPDGKFLFTDYRYIKNYSIEQLEAEIAQAGFAISEKKIITPQIRDACLLASKQRKKIVDDIIPWYLRKYFYHYAILNGSKKSAMLQNGEIVYFLYHLTPKALPLSPKGGLGNSR